MYPRRRRVDSAAVAAASHRRATAPPLSRPRPALPVAHLVLAPLVLRLNLHLHLNYPPPTRTHKLTRAPQPRLLTYTPRCHASSQTCRLPARWLQCIRLRCPRATAAMRCDANWWPVSQMGTWHRHLCRHTKLTTTITVMPLTTTTRTQRCDAGWT